MRNERIRYLHDEEGLSYAELGGRFNLSPSRVGQIVHAARKAATTAAARPSEPRPFDPLAGRLFDSVAVRLLALAIALRNAL